MTGNIRENGTQNYGSQVSKLSHSYSGGRITILTFISLVNHSTVVTGRPHGRDGMGQMSWMQPIGRVRGDTNVDVTTRAALGAHPEPGRAHTVAKVRTEVPGVGRVGRRARKERGCPWRLKFLDRDVEG